MCGIAGWLNWNVSPDSNSVGRMVNALHHRGPDASGVISIGPVCLGHARLSIIDVSEAANQPFSDSNRQFHLVFNGEIYNFREIRAILESDGVRFRTHSDTEVVLEAYKKWGTECVSRFNGMFAFALWDETQQQLFLARDRSGEKPLFYRRLPSGGFLFASEPRALRQVEKASLSLNTAALSQYLSINYTVGTHTLYRDIERLPPASCMLISRERERIWQYWDLAAHFHNKTSYRSEHEAAEALGVLFDDAVGLRMVSDVPLGAFLSGGIDSSATVAAMAQHRPAGEINTFSMGFTSAGYSELNEARHAAKYLGVDHHDQTLSTDASHLLESLIHIADEPLADSSFFATYWLAQFARQKVTVALSGDGGDECFAGYETYLADRIHAIISPLIRPVATQAAWLIDHAVPVSFAKVSFDYKLRQFVAAMRFDAQRAHYSWRTIFSPDEMQQLCKPDWYSGVGADAAFEEFQHHYAAVAECHPLDQALYVDSKTWLPDDILVKVDRATMAHSLESRTAFLDHRVLEFAASLPPELKLKRWRKKHILKLSQRARLPHAILERKKRGFNAPVSHWFNDTLRDYVNDTLRDPNIGEWFNPAFIDQLLTDHAKQHKDNGLKLLGLICFAIWINQQ